MSNSLWPHGLYSPWNSPGQNTGVGSLSCLQGIFPTQGSNPGLLHCRQNLYQLSQQGSPKMQKLHKYFHSCPEGANLVPDPHPAAGEATDLWSEAWLKPRGLYYRGRPCFTALCFIVLPRQLYKLKVCGSLALSRAMGAVFPTEFAHFVTLCHVLIILAMFLTFSLLFYLLRWSMICDLRCYYCNCLGYHKPQPHKRTNLINESHVFWLLHGPAAPSLPLPGPP